MKKNIRKRTVVLIMALVFSLTSIVYNVQMSQAEEETKCTVFVSGAEGEFYYKSEGEADYKKIENGSVELEKGAYSVRYVGGYRKLAAVSAAGDAGTAEGEGALEGEISLDATGNAWRQCWEMTATLSGNLSLTARESSVQISLQGASAIVPDTEYVLQFTGETADIWDVSKLPEYTLKTHAEGVTLWKDGDTWKLKYSGAMEPILKEIQVDAYASADAKPEGLTNETGKPDTPEAAPDFSSVLPVSNAGVICGEDYDIGAAEGMYTTAVDGVRYIYHNEASKTINIYKKRYTSFRYHFAGAAYPADYTIFGEDENEHKVELVDGILYLQMKNEDVSPTVFGSSGEVQVVSDTTAPAMDLYVNDEKQDISSEIRLKQDDILSVRVTELPDGSGVAKITQKTNENETLLAAAEERVFELGSSVSYTDGSTEFTIYAYDNVGNKETLYFSVSADTSSPVIEVKPGQDAYAYEKDEAYYVDSYTKEAVTVTYQDVHLDKDSIRSGGPVSAIAMPEYEEGYPYTVGYRATANGTATFDAADTYGNEAAQAKAQVVVDTSAPVVNAGSVHLTDADDMRKTQGYKVYSPYGTLYEAEAFHEPLLSFQVTEANLLKIEIEAGSADNIITLLPNTPEGETYTYTDIPLGELSAFVKGNIRIKVYDKVMHETVYTYQNPYADKVTYIKTEAVLSAPEVVNPLIVKSGKTYLITDHGRVDMLLHISADILVPELLELRLMRVAADGSKTQIASYRDGGQQSFTVNGDAGEWEVLFDYSFSPADDGAYMIEAYYMDIALNRIISTESEVVYYIDQTPVTLSVSSVQVKHGERTNQTVQVVYTMEEVNPDFASIQYEFKSEVNSAKYNIVDVIIVKPDGTRASVPISELTTRLNDPSLWKQQGDVYTLTLEYDKESRYGTMLTVGDMMGNEASAVYDFQLDTDAPGMISVDINTDYESKHNTSYKKFDPSKAEITVKLKEEIVSAAQMSVICKTTDLTTGEEKNVTPVAFATEGNMFTYTFTLKKDFKGNISFKTSDGLNYGNSSGVVIENGIILESKEKHQQTSAYSITENSTPNENGFYRKDVSLKFIAQDSYSGIRTIEYSLNGKKTKEDFGKQKELKTDWEKSPVYLEAVKANEGNDIKAVLTVEDNAGHRDTVEKNFKIDVTKPVISVSYDNDNMQNGKYYKENRTATITIRELNYDAKKTSVIVYKDGVSITKKPTFHSDGTVKKAEDGTQYKEYEMQLPFTEDGDYTFQVETTDLAGNKGTYTLKSEFTIDKTPPKMELRFDNNAPFKEQYFGEGRTATITVTEHNFDPAGIVADIKASRDGAGLAAPVLSSFTSKGDIHTAQVTFRDEADYSIAVTGLDLAGNTGDSVSQQTFTVDLSAPEIAITGISEGMSYNREVRPVVTVIDGNFDMEGVTIEIAGGRNGEVKDVTPAMTRTDQGYSYSYPDLKYVQGCDDCYTIKAKAIDKSGHETEAAMRYRVNRFGSTYVLNDALQKMVDGYYGKTSDAYSIIETNVDTLTEYQVSYTLDGEIVNLKEGTDYTVVKSQDAGSWNQYEYKLKASVFEKEGIYAITVASKDAAGNITDNKAKNTTMEFCIDNTVPSCIISGVAEGQRFEKDETVSIGIEVYDNTRLAQVSVLLNGTELYTEQDLVEGKIKDISIDRTVKNQTLTVRSLDAAGNERVETVNFICQVSVFDMPAWLWSIIGAAGAGVLILLAVAMRRRKKIA